MNTRIDTLQCDTQRTHTDTRTRAQTFGASHLLQILSLVKQCATTDKNINIRQLAAEVLLHVGLQCIPEQIWLLRDQRWHIRRNALQTISNAAES
jgi:hypothetical protein